MRQVFIIGIGPGDPEQLTVQAITKLNRVDVFFLMDKGQEKQELVQLRRNILERYIEDPTYRLVHAQDPDRDRTPSNYVDTVREWHQRRADLYEQLICDELGDDECGGILAWGDPTLYDNTIAVIDEVLRRQRVRFNYEVIPGISSISSLVARHRISVNQIGNSVQITTGRKFDHGFPEDVDDVIVMLDAHARFAQINDEDIDIFWGAYLGTSDEILISGRLQDVADRIALRRSEARRRKGWIMDTYLLRRRR